MGTFVVPLGGPLTGSTFAFRMLCVGSPKCRERKCEERNCAKPFSGTRWGPKNSLSSVFETVLSESLFGPFPTVARAFSALKGLSHSKLPLRRFPGTGGCRSYAVASCATVTAGCLNRAETPLNFGEKFRVFPRTILENFSEVNTQTAVLVSRAEVWISAPDAQTPNFWGFLGIHSRLWFFCWTKSFGYFPEVPVTKIRVSAPAPYKNPTIIQWAT